VRFVPRKVNPTPARSPLSVNEAPSITSAASFNVAENQTAVADVQFSDLDGEAENGGGLVGETSRRCHR
jgi:hypothetical protein